MGLDGGGLADLNARLGYDGTKYEYDTWNRDLTLSEAFRFSCVPYYKKLTGRLEKTYVQEVLGRLGYGNRDISVWNSNGHNVFWIESSLLISPREQLRVLERIFSGRSGFSQRHVALLKECMRYESIGKIGFYGKTGTGRNHNTNRLEAWCVGFLEYPDGGIVYLAVLARTGNGMFSAVKSVIPSARLFQRGRGAQRRETGTDETFASVVLIMISTFRYT